MADSRRASNSAAMGNNPATPRNAATFNNPTTSRSAAMGDNRTPSRNAAMGNRNTAMGNRNTATGTHNVAAGTRNAATGNRNTAMGDNRTPSRSAATGNSNTATGNRNAATGNGSLAVPQTMPPHLLPTTPTPTPESSNKVTDEMIRKASHGDFTGDCYRPMCMGFIRKFVTNEQDPKGWHLECTRKDARLRPCNYRRDADGNETKPLPRPPPPTPTRELRLKVPNVAQGPTPTSTGAEKGGVATSVSGSPNATKTGENQQASKEAPKQYGSTQRKLFPQAGKRPASELTEGSHTPPAKRVCDPVRPTSPSKAANKAKEEFDEQTRKRPASDYRGGSHTPPPAKRVCNPEVKDEFDDEFDDDIIDLDWLDAATEVVKSVEANSRSKMHPAVFNKTGTEASLAETPSKPPRQTKLSNTTTKSTMAPAETPSKQPRQTKASHHNDPGSSKPPHHNNPTTKSSHQNNPTSLKASHPTNPTTSKPSHPNNPTSSKLSTLNDPASSKASHPNHPSSKQHGRPAWKQRGRQKQQHAPAQPTAQTDRHYPPPQLTSVPEYVHRMATEAPPPPGPRIYANPGAKTSSVQGQSAMMPPPPSRQGFKGKPLVAWTSPAAPVNKGPGGTQADPIELD